MQKPNVVRVTVASYGVVDPLGFEYPYGKTLSMVETGQIKEYIAEGVLTIETKKPKKESK